MAWCIRSARIQATLVISTITGPHLCIRSTRIPRCWLVFEHEPPSSSTRPAGRRRFTILSNNNDDATLLQIATRKSPSVHLEYLEAGASVLMTGSYQATIQGFLSRGFSQEESESLLRKSVELAREARDAYLDKCYNSSDEPKDRTNYRKRPILIAASIGSYGAYLADGSEYSGDYGNEGKLESLKKFHRRRLQVLAEAGPDVIVFETIPNKIETQAYVELLEECNLGIPAWFAFTSKDGTNVVSGDSLTECASVADSCKEVAAVGINCTPPRFIHALVLSVRKVTNKPILIYPNSGESYDPIRKEWVACSGVSNEDFVSYVKKWHEAGASLIGGCCRTTPHTIRGIWKALHAV